MAWHLRDAAGVEPRTLIYASAAVEMIHTASILHDDVIDGGVIRRGLPTFWKEKGAAGAILFGDLLLFKAIDIICQVADGRLTHRLVQLTGQVCEAESEQEIVLQGEPSKLEYCLSIARRKTGALFAFIGYAAGGEDTVLRDLLEESGFRMGTAYQLADDVLDISGNEEAAGKTLGTDSKRDIISAANLISQSDEDPLKAIRVSCEAAISMLAEFPAASQGAQRYLDEDIGPAIDKLLEASRETIQ